MGTKIKVIEPFNEQDIKDAAQVVRDIQTDSAKAAVAEHFCEQFMFCPSFNRDEFLRLCGLKD